MPYSSTAIGHRAVHLNFLGIWESFKIKGPKETVQRITLSSVNLKGHLDFETSLYNGYVPFWKRFFCTLPLKRQPVGQLETL